MNVKKGIENGSIAVEPQKEEVSDNE